MTVAKPRYQFKTFDVHAAITRRLRAIERRMVASALLVAFSLFSLLAAGYFLTYTLFFAELPISKLYHDWEADREESFVYRGIAYFKGARLSDGDSVHFDYVVPRIVAGKAGKELELFIRIEDYADAEAETAASPGRLRVVQGDHVEPQLVELQPMELQRHRVGWHPLRGESNRLEVHYEADESAATDDAPDVVFGTNLRRVTFWPLTFAWLLAAVVALGVAMRLRPSITFATVAAVGAPLFLMFYVHSGAFISNELFGAPLRMRGMGSALLDLVGQGHFSPTMYRGAGIIFVPLITALVEWRFDSFAIVQRDFASIFPTWRYVLFAWTAVSLAVLLIVLNRHLGRAVAITTGILTATFVPYVSDLYYPESDSFLIPPMLMLAGLFIALCHRPRAPVSWGLVLGIGVVLMGMLSVKVQPMVLLPILPLALYGQSVLADRTWRDRTALALLCVLFAAVVAGSNLRAGFYHPERHVGIEGVDFQSHNFWSQLYWGFERYDRGGSAHGPDSSVARRLVMEEMLGLHGANYPHHSQIAQDQVYRPAVLNAFRERPGYFYSHFFMRAYNEAVRFLHYSQGRRFLHEASLTDWLDSANYGEFWKIAPLAMLIQSVQNDLPKALDVALLILALIGIALVKRVDVMFFLYGCVAASYSHAILFHGLTRYFNFLNFALLIGLAIFIVASIISLRRATRIP